MGRLNAAIGCAAAGALWAVSGCSPLAEGNESEAQGWPALACDELVPDVCGLPFPSNVFTLEDASTASGRRVSLPRDVFPTPLSGVSAAPEPWSRFDGFPPSTPIVAHLEGVDEASLGTAASFYNISRSLQVDSPTVLIDAESGIRVPHAVELDISAVGQSALSIRPAVPLRPGRRYIVAIRGLRDEAAKLIEPGQAFAELRDRTASEHSGVKDRRSLYADLFARLENAGIEVEDLQLAWDFTVASDGAHVVPLAEMLTTSLAWVGERGPSFVIDEVDDTFSADQVLARVLGHMTVPSFLTRRSEGAALSTDAEGRAQPNLMEPWVNVGFEVIIPRSALDAPAALLQYGHDTFGSKTEIEDEALVTFANEYNYVLFAVDHLGRSSAERPEFDDALTSGRFDRVASLVAREQQGLLEALLAMRMMKGGFAQDPAFAAQVDPEQAFYYGFGQGGSLGAAYLALSPDVDRGVLDAAGLARSLSISRSASFDAVVGSARSQLSDGREWLLATALLQLLWEPVDSASFAQKILEDRIDGRTGTQVLLRAADGDQQTPVLASRQLARAMGLELGTAEADVYAVDRTTLPLRGSAYVEYWFDIPQAPAHIEPQRLCNDPRRALIQREAPRQQLDHFLRTGIVSNFCDGPCRSITLCNDD